MSTPKKPPQLQVVVTDEHEPERACCAELRTIKTEISGLRAEIAALRAAAPSAKEKYALIAAFIVGVVGKIIEKNYGISIPLLP